MAVIQPFQITPNRYVIEKKEAVRRTSRVKKEEKVKPHKILTEQIPSLTPCSSVVKIMRVTHQEPEWE